MRRIDEGNSSSVHINDSLDKISSLKMCDFARIG
jgi:hypothetical protein